MYKSGTKDKRNEVAMNETNSKKNAKNQRTKH